MANKIYSTVCETFGKVIPKRLAEIIVSSAIASSGADADTIDLDQMSTLLRGKIFSRLSVFQSISNAKGTVRLALSAIHSQEMLSSEDILKVVFTPSKPITTQDLFRGRSEQLEALRRLLDQDGSHGVLYGERGVGKTSIANIFAIMNDNRPNTIFVQVTCNSEESYQSLWERIFENTRISREEFESSSKLNSPKSRVNGKIKLSDMVKADMNYTASNVIKVLKSVNKHLVIIIDEFDRIEGGFSKKLLADTIKIISDTVYHVTIIIVGVGESINELIGEHKSIERNLRQIELPLMKATELEEIVQKGFLEIGLSANESIVKRITNQSCGYPYYTHLISLHACQEAIDNDEIKVQEKHFKAGVRIALSETQESLRDVYQAATFSNHENIFKQVLWACAMVKIDQHGYFRASDLEEPLSQILGRAYIVRQFAYHLNKLAAGENSVLVKMEKNRQKRYKIRNPLMRPFLLLSKENDAA